MYCSHIAPGETRQTCRDVGARAVFEKKFRTRTPGNSTNGLEALQLVREVRPATNIAFLSGYDDFEYAQQAIRYNVISYMLKPLTVQGLGEELRVIHQKIDTQFAAFRQAPPQADGQERSAAMLFTLDGQKALFAFDRRPD